MSQKLRDCDLCKQPIYTIDDVSLVWIEKTLWGRTECEETKIVHNHCALPLEAKRYGIGRSFRSVPIEFMLHHKTASVAAKISPGLEKCFDELAHMSKLCGLEAGKKRF